MRKWLNVTYWWVRWNPELLQSTLDRSFIFYKNSFLTSVTYAFPFVAWGMGLSPPDDPPAAASCKNLTDWSICQQCNRYSRFYLLCGEVLMHCIAAKVGASTVTRRPVLRLVTFPLNLSLGFYCSWKQGHWSMLTPEVSLWCEPNVTLLYQVSNATMLEGPSEQVQEVEATNSILGDTESWFCWKTWKACLLRGLCFRLYSFLKESRELCRSA